MAACSPSQPEMRGVTTCGMMTAVHLAAITARTRAAGSQVPERRVYTIGHSTRPLDDFVSQLKQNEVRALADVRRFPGSKRFPHFCKDQLKRTLPEIGIDYFHFEE